MGCPFLRSFSADLRDRNLQTYFHGPDEDIWHHDLVATGVVAARLWDGLIRTQRGVYELRTYLSQPSGIPDGADSAGASQAAFTYKYFPDAPANNFIERARQLSEVQKVLWFDRFPVTRFHKEGADSGVEILELRFPRVRPDRPAAFTYRVRFDASGNVISQGWEEN